jgi:hypothetical protein
MEPKKAQVIAALRAFINQRPGLEFGNYGSVPAYRAECRQIAKDRRDALELLRAVEWRDSITAEAIIEAAKGAYSGRLTIETRDSGAVAVGYCTGQYFPTEYRKAAGAVLASALWRHAADECMPEPSAYVVESFGKWNGRRFEHETSKPLPLIEAAELHARLGGSEYGGIQKLHDGLRPGDWLRAHFRKEFGRSIASRWFR